MFMLRGGMVYDRLNDRQKRFCDTYLIDLNATQVAIRAGYSTKQPSRCAINFFGKLQFRESPIPPFHSHLKKRIEIVVHIIAIIIITTAGIKTLWIGNPSDAALRSFIPCVNGNISATLCNATGITS